MVRIQHCAQKSIHKISSVSFQNLIYLLNTVLALFRVTRTLTNNIIVKLIATCETFSIQLLISFSRWQKCKEQMQSWHSKMTWASVPRLQFISVSIEVSLILSRLQNYSWNERCHICRWLSLGFLSWLQRIFCIYIRMYIYICIHNSQHIPFSEYLTI